MGERAFYRAEHGGEIGPWWARLVRLGDRLRILPGTKHYLSAAESSLQAEIDRKGATAIGGIVTEVRPVAGGGMQFVATALVDGPPGLGNATDDVPVDIVDQGEDEEN